MEKLAPTIPFSGIVIDGFGGHARSIVDVALSLGIAKFIFVDANARGGETFAGSPVLKEMPHALEYGWAFFPSSGQAVQRQSSLALASKRKFELCCIISPKSSIGYASTIGTGVFVGHQAHIGPSVKIGDGAIINSGAVVEHDVTIGAFTHVSINATVAGRSRIGENCFLGAGSTVIDNISIADDVVLGAGACAVSDITMAGTYVGLPARRLK